MLSSDHFLFQIEGFLLVLVLAAYGLRLLVVDLRRRHNGLRIGDAVTAAMVIRVLAAAAVSLLPNSRSLRGGDELVFLSNAQVIRAHPLLSLLTGHGISPLHQWLFALQQHLFDASEFTLRLTQITLSVVGLTFLAAAVCLLAGATRARLAVWLVAIEPTNIFFSSWLHKEPLITLAMGLVAYGGAKMWTRRSLTAAALMSAGCAIATLARPYAGWFLIGAAAAITAHSAMRRQHGRRAALSAVAVASLILVVIPFGLQAAPAQLKALQQSQTANTHDSSHLKYDKVDYSSPVAIAANLPGRVADFMFRPYPWQLQNTNQQLGAIGGLVGLIAVGFFVLSLGANRRSIMPRAGPLLYVTGFLLVAYAAASGNAGTAFRLRENVTALLICAACILHHFRDQEGFEREQPAAVRTAVQGAALPTRGPRHPPVVAGHPR